MKVFGIFKIYIVGFKILDVLVRVFFMIEFVVSFESLYCVRFMMDENVLVFIVLVLRLEKSNFVVMVVRVFGNGVGINNGKYWKVFFDLVEYNVGSSGVLGCVVE